jgi:hypothetical protein
MIQRLVAQANKHRDKCLDNHHKHPEHLFLHQLLDNQVQLLHRADQLPV